MEFLRLRGCVPKWVEGGRGSGVIERVLQSGWRKGGDEVEVLRGVGSGVAKIECSKISPYNRL